MSSVVSYGLIRPVKIDLHDRLVISFFTFYNLRSFVKRVHMYVSKMVSFFAFNSSISMKEKKMHTLQIRYKAHKDTICFNE
jgi:hypothetical protein